MTTLAPQSLSALAPAHLPFVGGALVPRFFDETIARQAWVAINRPENWIFLNRFLPQSYEAQIEWLKKQLFGAGKSEKLDQTQLRLALSELEKAPLRRSPRLKRSATNARSRPRRSARCRRTRSRICR